MPRPRATIETIAQSLGLTHGTVSRALRGDPRVKPATAERIRAAAERAGYVPSGIGRGLRSSRTMTLGIVVTYLTDPFFADVIRGVHDTVSPHGYSLFVASGSESDEEQNAIANRLWEQRADGLFLTCLSRLPTAWRRQFENPRAPLVVVNNHYGVEYPYAVSHDDARAVKACVEHLVALGHRRLGFLGNARAGATNDVRLAAFHAAAAAAGAPSREGDVVLADGGGLEAGCHAMRHWLARPARMRPTALLCFNDLVAGGALAACRERQVRVPRELSMVGFDDIELAAFLDPPLTTFSQPRYELGRRAGAAMLRLLTAEPPPPAPELLYGALVMRGSTAAPRSHR